MLIKAFFVEANINEIAGQFFSSSYKYNFTSAEFLRLASETYNKSSDIQEAVTMITNACHDFPLAIKQPDKMKDKLPPKVQEYLMNPWANGDWRSFLKACFIQFYVGGEVILVDLSDMGAPINNPLFLCWPNEMLKVQWIEGFAFQVSAF